MSDAYTTNATSVQPTLARVLRWWPAATILLLMAIVKLVPNLFESPGIGVLMFGFMGPAAIGLLLVPWWLFASRASLIEKAVGGLGLLAVAVVSILFNDVSMQGMATVLFQIPFGLFTFGLALVLLARAPAARVPVALIASAMAFGYWSLLRMDGTTGRFDAELAWRWSESAEDEYLRSLASQSGDAAAIDSENVEVITSTESAWPEFRGDGRKGIVRGVSLATDWSKQAPSLKWKTLIGPGWSSFAAAGERLFTQEQRGEEEAVVCVSAETGETLWVQTYPARFWEAIGGAGPRATPTIGENQLFTMGADGQVTAFRPATGEVLWKRNLRDDAGREPPQWGWSASPLIVDGKVIVHAGGANDKGIIAYAIETGEPVWSCASGDHSYSSPQLANFHGVEGVLMMTNGGLQFVNVADGTTIWNYDWKVENYRAIQPLVGDNYVLIATSLGIGTRKLSVQKDGDQWLIEEQWNSLKMKPEFNDYVVFNDHLYGFDGNILACVDMAKGEKVWKRGRYGNGQLLLLADSAQLLIISEKGELALVAADPEEFRELAKIEAIEGKTWNHPVLIGNRVYVRNGQEAACFELSLAELDQAAKL